MSEQIRLVTKGRKTAADAASSVLTRQRCPGSCSERKLMAGNFSERPAPKFVENNTPVLDRKPPLCFTLRFRNTGRAAPVCTGLG